MMLSKYDRALDDARYSTQLDASFVKVFFTVEYVIYKTFGWSLGIDVRKPLLSAASFPVAPMDEFSGWFQYFELLSVLLKIIEWKDNYLALPE